MTQVPATATTNAPQYQIDIFMLNTIIAKQTRIPDAANGSTLIHFLVPFESCSQLLSNNSDNFESMTNTVEFSDKSDSFPGSFLETSLLAPLVSDALSAPPLMNLEQSGLRRFPRIAALQNATNANINGPDIVAAYSVSIQHLSWQMRSYKPQLSFFSVFNFVGSFWTFHASLLLPFKKDNSAIMMASYASLLLPFNKDKPAIRTATNATFSLQLIVESFPQEPNKSLQPQFAMSLSS